MLVLYCCNAERNAMIKLVFKLQATLVRTYKFIQKWDDFLNIPLLVFKWKWSHLFFGCKKVTVSSTKREDSEKAVVNIAHSNVEYISQFSHDLDATMCKMDSQMRDRRIEAGLPEREIMYHNPTTLHLILDFINGIWILDHRLSPSIFHHCCSHCIMESS